MSEQRYARQIALPEIGTAGQLKLAATRVLIVGAGGLGVPAMSYLAGAGIGSLRLVDDDLISVHNLHRQVLFTEAEQGQYKVEVAAKKMAALNSEVRVEALCQRLVSSNVEELIEGCDSVIDAADNFATTYLLSDTCQQLNTPLISASAAGTKGYMGVFCQRAPSYRALFPQPPAQGLSCSNTGVLGPLVAVLGALQAQAAMQLALGEHSPAQLINVDLWTMAFSSFDFSHAEESDSQNVVANQLTILGHDEICASDLLVDVREAAELNAPKLAAAKHIPLGEIAQRHGEIARDRRVVLCCQSAGRARAAAAILRAKNYQNLAVLALN